MKKTGLRFRHEKRNPVIIGGKKVNVSAVRKMDAGDGASHVVELAIADISRSMNVLADPIQKSADFSKMHTFHNIAS